MTPVEHGQHLASLEPPLTPEQVELVARTFVALDAEQAAA